LVAQGSEMERLRWAIFDFIRYFLSSKGQASEGRGAVPATVQSKAEVVGDQSYVQRNP
jgi:hypothetical protein